LWNRSVGLAASPLGLGRHPRAGLAAGGEGDPRHAELARGIQRRHHRLMRRLGIGLDQHRQVALVVAARATKAWRSVFAGLIPST
jgi:hypothetical protein